MPRALSSSVINVKGCEGCALEKRVLSEQRLRPLRPSDRAQWTDISACTPHKQNSPRFQTEVQTRRLFHVPLKTIAAKSVAATHGGG